MSELIEESVALELLANLVAIDSVNPVYGGPGEAGVADFVRTWLSDRGISFEVFEVEAGRSNIVARIGPQDGSAVMLEAHMDTVGVEGWATGSAHELVRRGDCFFGRGACDTKASLACFLLTLERFSRDPKSLGRGLVFAATVDEESEQFGAYDLAKYLKGWGVGGAVTGEPTCSDVIGRHKGVGRYLINTSGKAAHASAPELGRNAIYSAARVCAALESLAADLAARDVESEIQRGSLSVGVIGGGIGFNVVPDRCRIDIDRRFGTSEDASEARGALEAICETEDGAALEVFLERPALRGEGSSELVDGLLSSGTAVGESNKEREVSYMTNAVAYEEVGVASVVFGPGDIAQAHKNDEFIEAGQMLRSLKILERFFLKG